MSGCHVRGAVSGSCGLFFLVGGWTAQDQEQMLTTVGVGSWEIIVVSKSFNTHISTKPTRNGRPCQGRIDVRVGWMSGWVGCQGGLDVRVVKYRIQDLLDSCWSIMEILVFPKVSTHTSRPNRPEMVDHVRVESMSGWISCQGGLDVRVLNQFKQKTCQCMPTYVMTEFVFASPQK